MALTKEQEKSLISVIPKKISMIQKTKNLIKSIMEQKQRHKQNPFRIPKKRFGIIQKIKQIFTK
jgi:hypothetical protein